MSLLLFSDLISVLDIFFCTSFPKDFLGANVSRIRTRCFRTSLVWLKELLSLVDLLQIENWRDFSPHFYWCKVSAQIGGFERLISHSDTIIVSASFSRTMRSEGLGPVMVLDEHFRVYVCVHFECAHVRAHPGRQAAS